MGKKQNTIQKYRQQASHDNKNNLNIRYQAAAAAAIAGTICCSIGASVGGTKSICSAEVAAFLVGLAVVVGFGLGVMVGTCNFF